MYRDSRVKAEQLKQAAVSWSRIRAVTIIADRDSLHRMRQNAGRDQ